MAVFYETLRLFPPVSNHGIWVLSCFFTCIQVVSIPKEAACDTTLLVHVSSNDSQDPKGAELEGQRKAVFIPKGATVYLNAAGVHYNRECSMY